MSKKNNLSVAGSFGPPVIGGEAQRKTGIKFVDQWKERLKSKKYPKIKIRRDPYAQHDEDH